MEGRMELSRKTLAALVLAGIAAAVPTYVVLTRLAVAPVASAAIAAAPARCFTADAVTYQLSSRIGPADYRVKIDASAQSSSRADLRIQLVDEVDSADFALVDDAGARDTCASSGVTRTVRVVDDPGPADLTLSLSADAADADVKLFVHSSRFSSSDAAALFAAMRRHQRG
jgi:hypothetical protein